MDRAESKSRSCRIYHSCRGEMMLLLALHLSACSAYSAQALQGEPLYQKLNQRLDAMEKFAGQKECGQELQELLTDARKECSANDTSATTPSTENAEASSDIAALAKAMAEPDSSCGTEKLKGTLKRAERSLNLASADRARGKRKAPHVSPLVHMLNQFSCGVVYIDGASEVPQDRVDQLHNLVELPDLPQTRYIVFTSTAHGEIEAQHRVEVMRQQLAALNVPAERIDKPWLYPFDLQPVQIVQRKLLPQPPAEPSELSRAVWVCRTNC